MCHSDKRTCRKSPKSSGGGHFREGASFGSYSLRGGSAPQTEGAFFAFFGGQTRKYYSCKYPFVFPCSEMRPWLSKLIQGDLTMQIAFSTGAPLGHRTALKWDPIGHKTALKWDPGSPNIDLVIQVGLTIPPSLYLYTTTKSKLLQADTGGSHHSTLPVRPRS